MCAAAQVLTPKLSYNPPNSPGDALTRVFAFGGASLDHQPRAPIAYFIMFQAQQPAVGVTNAKLDAIAGDLAGVRPDGERPCALDRFPQTQTSSWAPWRLTWQV